MADSTRPAQRDTSLTGRALASTPRPLKRCPHCASVVGQPAPVSIPGYWYFCPDCAGEWRSSGQNWLVGVGWLLLVLGLVTGTWWLSHAAATALSVWVLLAGRDAVSSARKVSA